MFFVVNPFGTAPLFVPMTQDDSPEKRNQMAWCAAVTTFVTLSIFTIFENLLLQFFAITIGAFRVTGGVLIFSIGLHRLCAQRAREIQTPEEGREGMEKTILLLSRSPFREQEVAITDEETWIARETVHGLQHAVSPQQV